MDGPFYQAAALIVPLIIAIVFHEVAHGLVARRLGDPTAQEMGRLTFNPLRHVDPVGTVILPGMLALASLPVFGWAKPVPVIAQRLNHPRRDMMLVAAAGPASNLVLAGIGAVLLGLLARVFAGDAGGSPLVGFAALNLVNFLAINVFLAIFNLLPIPPFDGSHIVEGLLPGRLRAGYAKVRRLGFALVLVLLILLPTLIPGFDPLGAVIRTPVGWLTDHYMALAGWVSGGSSR
ncbi:site-2 protease family protein [Novosphingobium flavum]|uniref:Site-2 protease family protein n=1 Tax=Novosphingobium flavum TaxID=1778672 RepID=A0A7X1FTI6_9SPHN|nr:site-2 protease family protein [Novosphingobium flavum]MBC2666197.1 site-2 protease family protein [Novosphingobium flavum]